MRWTGQNTAEVIAFIKQECEHHKIDYLSSEIRNTSRFEADCLIFRTSSMPQFAEPNDLKFHTCDPGNYVISHDASKVGVFDREHHDILFTFLGDDTAVPAIRDYLYYDGSNIDKALAFIHEKNKHLSLKIVYTVKDENVIIYKRGSHASCTLSPEKVLISTGSRAWPVVAVSIDLLKQFYDMNTLHGIPTQERESTHETC
jgi:hypothetical protein